MKRIDGYCEIWGNVIETIIQVYDDDFSIYNDNDLNDGFDTWEDFIKETGGKLYLTLKDYKKDNFIDLNEWKNAS